ncbi:DUF3164 family protein [Citrobacter braakii]|uniref:DUF3164 family protein n=1 Tax=Citrobacter braakii TaxID=57706 RepID=UPI003524F5A6
MKTVKTYKQFTTKEKPEGYWIDGRGVLTPDAMVKEIDMARDNIVGELVTKAIELSTLLDKLKNTSFSDVQAFIDLSAERYGATIGGKKGNISLFSYDSRYKIQRAIADNIKFDEQLQAAKSLIDECIGEWMDGSRPEILALINRAFEVNKEGDVTPAKLYQLRSLDIQDERWLRAMDAIAESIKVVGKKAYIRFYERVGDTGEYKPISLDIAGV